MSGTGVGVDDKKAVKARRGAWTGFPCLCLFPTLRPGLIWNGFGHCIASRSQCYSVTSWQRFPLYRYTLPPHSPYSSMLCSFRSTTMNDTPVAIFWDFGALPVKGDHPILIATQRIVPSLWAGRDSRSLAASSPSHRSMARSSSSRPTWTPRSSLWAQTSSALSCNRPASLSPTALTLAERR